MDYDLTDDYLEDARRRAYRFQGQWCGTSGSLAADVARLLIDRKRLMTTITTLEEQNAALRNAVETRIAGGCCDGGKCQPSLTDAAERWQEMTKASAEKYAAERAIDEKGPLRDVDEVVADDDAALPSDWILQGQRELEAAPDDIRWTGDSILADKADLSPAEKLLMDALDVIRDRRPKYGGPRHHFRRTIGMINAAFADVLKRPLTESDWAIFMTFDKVARFLGPNKTADGPIDLAGYAACLAECESAEPV